MRHENPSLPQIESKNPVGPGRDSPWAAGMRFRDRPIEAGEHFEDGGGRYEVVGVEESSTPNGIGRAWVRYIGS